MEQRSPTTANCLIDKPLILLILSTVLSKSEEETLANKKGPSPEEETVELLRNILIVQLGLARVPQYDIRKVAGCGINRVNDVLKHIPKSNR